MAKLPRIPEGWKNDLVDDPESITVEGSPPPSDGATWEAKAYFLNPKKGGWLAQPKKAVHSGIKIYRNGAFVSSIDAGPQLDHVLQDGTLGNLIFGRAPDSLSANNRSALADKEDNGEITLTPPHGVSPQNFAQALMMAAKSYGRLPSLQLAPFGDV